MRGNPNFHPAIREARRKADAAKSHRRRVIREVQSSCQHTEVLEAPYKSGDWLGAMPAQRTCRTCGLTEYSAWGGCGSSWGPLTSGPCSMGRDYSRKPVLTTEFVKKVTRDEIRRYQCR